MMSQRKAGSLSTKKKRKLAKPRRGEREATERRKKTVTYALPIFERKETSINSSMKEEGKDVEGI